MLNRDFKDFLSQYDFNHLVLCGKVNGPRTMCEVKFHRDDDIVIGAFEQCSQSLCIENEFQSGDTIRFKFFDGVVSHYV